MPVKDILLAGGGGKESSSNIATCVCLPPLGVASHMQDGDAPPEEMDM